MQSLKRIAVMKNQRKYAYTLTELILVVMIIGVISAIAIPRMNLASINKTNAEITANRIVTSLRRTRRLAISQAAVNQQGFQLEFVQNDQNYIIQITNMKNAHLIDQFELDPEINISGQNKFSFGPLGNLIPQSGSQITVSSENAYYDISVTESTGSVKCQKQLQ